MDVPLSEGEGEAAVNSDANKGAPPPPSPLTGCYLLIVIGEPHSEEHKDIILGRIMKGLLSWNKENCHVDLETELCTITNIAPDGEETKHGERLIQFASENLVTEVLIHPATNTLIQCIKNLLSSFTRHRHIIHSGYTFCGNGSWALQDGTFSLSDFAEAFQEIEVQRVLRAYDNTISIDIHCSPEGDWNRLPKETFAKNCKVHVNPDDVLNSGSPLLNDFLNYISRFLTSTNIDTLLESSDVVGNIRFSHPTLYIFPGGQGDAALFGINGFNMLVDGGYARKACFWDFTRHLDRLDAVLITCLNNSNICGISSVLRRKSNNQVYPQIGHFFSNLQERKALSPDGDKDSDPLLINLLEEGHGLVLSLRQLNLRPQNCYRDHEPVNLYHKVGHGTLDMYVLSPAKDSKEVKEFMHKWNNNDQKLFSSRKDMREFIFPLHNLVSVCALLVWQPASPSDPITRILFPGSTPQQKIFEGLDKLKHLDFLKYPVCSGKSLTPSGSIAGLNKARDNKVSTVLDKLGLQHKTDNKVLKEKTSSHSENKQKEYISLSEIHNKSELNVKEMQRAQHEKIIKSDSIESEKSEPVADVKSFNDGNAKYVEQSSNIIGNDKTKLKIIDGKQSRLASQTKPRNEHTTKKSSERKPTKIYDKKNESKPSPLTPKKSFDSKMNGTKEKDNLKSKLSNKIGTNKASPTSTPAKSTKEANNRKVVELKKFPIKKETVKVLEKKEVPKSDKPVIAKKSKITSPAKGSKSLSSPVKKSVPNTDKNEEVSALRFEKENIADQEYNSNRIKISKTEQEELKAKELADLKEEQEVVEEIEAVFQKDEKFNDTLQSDLRKIPETSIEEKITEPEEDEEYLIIEKEELVDYVEVVSEQKNETKSEDEIQKHLRDSAESEKNKYNTDEIFEDKLKTTVEKDFVDKNQITGNICGQTKICSIDVGDENIIISGKITKYKSNEVSITSPEDKQDMSSDKKTGETKDAEDEEMKNEQICALESQPDEKFSTTIESGATTAPTLPEDERITLDEIKENQVDQIDQIDQVVEEKYAKEETKEKEVPIVALPPKACEATTNISSVVGIKFDSHQTHLRDIVKTPDEVADLPVHEEVDIDTYDFPGSFKKEEGKKEKSKEENLKVNDNINSEVNLKKNDDGEFGNVQKTTNMETKNVDVIEAFPCISNTPTVAMDILDTSTAGGNGTKQVANTSEIMPINEDKIHQFPDTSIKIPSPPNASNDKELVQIKDTSQILHKNDDDKNAKEILTVCEVNDQILGEKNGLVDTMTSDTKGFIYPVITDANEILPTDEKNVTQTTQDNNFQIEKNILESKKITPNNECQNMVFDDNVVREEVIANIVTNVAQVLKSDATLEELAPSLQIKFIPPKNEFGLTEYTTELRETHITTVHSPLQEDTPKIEIHETQMGSEPLAVSNLNVTKDELTDTGTKECHFDMIEEEDNKEGTGTVHRMLVTASSEDGGEETVICPAGSITFVRTESSGQLSTEKDAECTPHETHSSQTEEKLEQDSFEKENIHKDEKDTSDSFHEKSDKSHISIILDGDICDHFPTAKNDAKSKLHDVVLPDVIDDKLPLSDISIPPSIEIEYKDHIVKESTSDSFHEKSDKSHISNISDGDICDNFPTAKVDATSKLHDVVLPDVFDDKLPLSDISIPPSTEIEDKDHIVKESTNDSFNEKSDKSHKANISDGDICDNFPTAKNNATSKLHDVVLPHVFDDKLPLSDILIPPSTEIEDKDHILKESTSDSFHEKSDKSHISNISDGDIFNNFPTAKNDATSKLHDVVLPDVFDDKLPLSDILIPPSTEIEDTDHIVKESTSYSKIKISLAKEEEVESLETTSTLGKVTLMKNYDSPLISQCVSVDAGDNTNDRTYINKLDSTEMDATEKKGEIVEMAGNECEKYENNKLPDEGGSKSALILEQAEISQNEDEIKTKDDKIFSDSIIKHTDEHIDSQLGETSLPERTKIVESEINKSIDVKECIEMTGRQIKPGDIILEKPNKEKGILDVYDTENVSKIDALNLQDTSLIDKIEEHFAKSEIGNKNQTISESLISVNENCDKIPRKLNDSNQIEKDNVGDLKTEGNEKNGSASEIELCDEIRTQQNIIGLHDEKLLLSGKSTPESKSESTVEYTAKHSSNNISENLENFTPENINKDLNVITEIKSALANIVLNPTTDNSDKLATGPKDNLLSGDQYNTDKFIEEDGISETINGKGVQNKIVLEGSLERNNAEENITILELNSKDLPDNKNDQSLVNITDTLATEMKIENQNDICSNKKPDDEMKENDSQLPQSALNLDCRNDVENPRIDNVKEKEYNKPSCEIKEKEEKNYSNISTLPSESIEIENSKIIDKNTPENNSFDKTFVESQNVVITDFSKISGENKAGPSNTQKDTPAQSNVNKEACLSIEDLNLSGKSTPDIADVEKIKEIHEILKHEKHIPGSSTPPTVPVSPVIKESISDMSDSKAFNIESTKESKETADVIDTTINVQQSSDSFSDNFISQSSKIVSNTGEPDKVLEEKKGFEKVEITSHNDQIPCVSDFEAANKMDSMENVIDKTLQKHQHFINDNLKSESASVINISESLSGYETEDKMFEHAHHLPKADTPRGQENLEPVKITSEPNEEASISFLGSQNINNDEELLAAEQLKSCPLKHVADLEISAPKSSEINNEKIEIDNKVLLKLETDEKERKTEAPSSFTDKDNDRIIKTLPDADHINFDKTSDQNQPENIASTFSKIEILSTKLDDVQCTSPNSDDCDQGSISSPHSDISSGKMSRVALAWGQETSDERQTYSDEEVAESPISMTSQVAHSPTPPLSDTENETQNISVQICTTEKVDLMNMSLYGVLPDVKTELRSNETTNIHSTSNNSINLDEKRTELVDKITKDCQTVDIERVSDCLVESTSYKYEITVAKFNKLVACTKSQSENIYSRPLMEKDTEGEIEIQIPSDTQTDEDVIKSWGKPLGLPSPALQPTNDVSNKTIPRKNIANALINKNKINDERKRSESPLKNERKLKKVTPVYLDLTYVPHHGNSYYTSVDFFRRVRARYYVFSGIEPSRDVYNALLEAKQTWEDKDLEVTIIPTYDTDVLGYWVAENEDLLAKHKIDLSPSASRCTINLQDHETSCSAYRLEF